MNKKYGIGLAVVIVIILCVFIVSKTNLFSNNTYEFKIYKNSNEISVSDGMKTKLNNILKKEKFTKINAECNINNTYKIEYNNIELSFDDDSCVFYKNNNTFENYYTNISIDLYNSVMDLTN